MKKFIYLILISFICLGAASFAFAQDNVVEIYYFYGSTCPVCKKVTSLLEEFREKYPSLKINYYEVFGDKENAKFFLQLLEACGEEKIVRVPVMFIGDEVIRGYLSEEVTGKKIEEVINNCLEKECPSPLDKINKCDLHDEPCACKEDTKEDQIISYPFIGNINLSSMSLPLLTFVVAALDGFNPCAMWLLLFLIALLINVRSRKRIWLVGGTFIAVSGVVYFLLLTAWLNLFLAISYVTLTRIIIGAVALIAGIWQVRKFTKFKPGVCEIAPVGGKWNERLSNKAQQVVHSESLWITVFGVIILALGVNFLEFFCSAGLPAIYTKILSLSHLSTFGYYLYLLLYTLVFMLDDMIIFTIAIITLSKIGFTEKYTKWSTLIGGLLILILGLLLIFKPDLLMFG
ncbi:MAG: thioredoxin family protein [Patescibacteria group bacterium]|nr:thioredoxin family protein [Patescibacteria group bacterium]